jgi:pimeloyl-ACP methyl ester carboxylesterase
VILRTETVEQTIDGAKRALFIKDVLMTPGTAPLGMVRKRRHGATSTRGAVLLVHGFGQNRYAWHSHHRSFSAYLANAGWDVFNADLRGHGRSRRFGAQRPQIMAEYIREDLPACAREALKLSQHEELFLIGHSMGGIVSYGAAATSLRDRVAGIVSLGSPYQFGDGSRVLAGIAAFLRAVRVTGVFDSNPGLPLRVVGRHFHRRRWLWDTKLVPMPVRPWKPGSMEEEVLEEYLRRAFDWTTLGIVFDILRAGREGLLTRQGLSDMRSAFELLDKPLLVIAGTEDGLAPPDSVRCAYTRSRATDRTYREFPAGHVDLILGRSAPVTVWPTISSWLERRAQPVPVRAA